MRRKRQRNMGWNTTNIIGAITLTMQQLGFNNSDIDLTIFGTLRIRQRFTPETIDRVGISWTTRMLPKEFFRGTWDDSKGDVLQDLADKFAVRTENTDGPESR